MRDRVKTCWKLREEHDTPKRCSKGIRERHDGLKGHFASHRGWGVRLFGRPERQIPLLRRSVGVIFQDFRLIEKKTVYENLGFAMRAVGSSPREIKKRIPYVLELVGLEEKTDRYPNELSGGEQQRVAIARALINNPSTIIADEPTGNLDPARSLEIMRLLERINQLGTTMVVVTHEKDLVNQFKKRVVTLEQGVITSDGDGVGYNAR